MPSFLISFRNSLRNFNEDILCLVFVFVDFIGSVATSGSVAGSDVDWHVGFFLSVFVPFSKLLNSLANINSFYY